MSWNWRTVDLNWVGIDFCENNWIEIYLFLFCRNLIWIRVYKMEFTPSLLGELLHWLLFSSHDSPGKLEKHLPLIFLKINNDCPGKEELVILQIPVSLQKHFERKGLCAFLPISDAVCLQTCSFILPPHSCVKQSSQP